MCWQDILSEQNAQCLCLYDTTVHSVVDRFWLVIFLVFATQIAEVQAACVHRLWNFIWRSEFGVSRCRGLLVKLTGAVVALHAWIFLNLQDQLVKIWLFVWLHQIARNLLPSLTRYSFFAPFAAASFLSPISSEYRSQNKKGIADDCPEHQQSDPSPRSGSSS